MYFVAGGDVCPGASTTAKGPRPQLVSVAEGSGHQFQRALGREFPTRLCVSQTSARCPAIQLDSDTVDLEVVSDPTGISPTRLLPTSDAKHKFKLSLVLLTDWQ